MTKVAGVTKVAIVTTVTIDAREEVREVGRLTKVTVTNKKEVNTKVTNKYAMNATIIITKNATVVKTKYTRRSTTTIVVLSTKKKVINPSEKKVINTMITNKHAMNTTIP